MARRVIFLITDLDLGGCPLLLLRIVRELKARGHFAPHVVSIKSPGPVARWIRMAGVEVTGLHASGPGDYQAFLRWVKLMRGQRPQGVLSMLLHANLLATVAAPICPPCVYLQSLHTLAASPAWHWPACSLVAGRCAGVLAPTRAILNRLSQEGFTGPQFVVPNGIDVSVFADAQPLPPDQLPWPAGSTVIGYVGRFDQVKRLDSLLRGFARLLLADYHRWRQVYLALIGYGPMEPPLRRLAAELGIASHVVFPGPTASPQTLYKCIDIFINPCNVEGFGLSIIEAMAAGVPVIARRGGAISEIITHQVNGWLFDPADFTAGHADLSADAEAQGIAESLSTLLSDAPLRHHLAVGGRNLVVGHYTTDRMVDVYEQILEKFI